MPAASHFLAAHLDAAAAANPAFDISALLAAALGWVKDNADPRKLIDTPDERTAIEAEVHAAAERLLKPVAIARFGEVMGGAFYGAIEPQVIKLLDMLLTALAATLPVPTPTPAPVVMPSTQGSAP